MSHIQQILVPLDFSDCSASVVSEASKLAAQLDARVCLLHAIKPPSGVSPDTIVRAKEGQERTALQYLRHTASMKLKFYTELIHVEGAREGALFLEFGDPAPVILATAARSSIDMIVMGTHGRVGLNRVVWGSVAETVLRSSMVPMVIIRAQHRAHCEARSCASCTAHISEEMAQLRADQDG